MNVLVCFFVCFAALCAAQNYQATLNQVTYLQSNFRGMNVFVDTDGVRYYTGQTTSTTVTSVLNNAYNLSPVNGTKGNLDIIVMRVEPNDVITWFTFIGSTAADQPGTSRSYQDFLYVSGSTSGIINGLQTKDADIYLVKLDRFTGKTISTVLITNQTGSDVLNIPKGGSVMEIQDHVLWIAGSRTIASVNSWNIISYDILTGTIQQTLWSPGSTSNPYVILIRDNNVWVGGSCSSNDPISADQDFSTNSINGCSVGFTKDASNTLTQSYLMTFDYVIYWIDLTENGSIYYTYEDQQRIRLFNATSNYNLIKTIPITGNAVPMLIPDRFNRIVMMSADASPTYAYYAISGELDNSWFSANAKGNMPTMDSNSLIHADYDDFTQSDTITIYYTGSHVNPSSKSNVAGYGNTYNSKASEAVSVRCIDIISIQVTVNDHWTTNALTSQALTTQAITTAAMTTAAMTTAAMTTAAMTTAAMTTNEMTTAAMTTNEMTTAAMTTAEMTTAAMTTAEFTTAAMTTAEMTTAAMTTNEMTTAAMTTNEMTTAAMTTAEFTTAAMTTNEMTTAAMTTNEMTTAAMTTAEFTTAAMTTAAMTTNEMTTAAMTTNEMTTAAMTTAAMTTSQMTTAAMTTAEFTTSPLTTAPLTTVYQVTSSAITTNVPALDGGANGDPHMDGFKGQAYEFSGTVGDVYNLYNDPYVNLNAKMGSRVGVTGTFMNAIYLTVGGHQITMESQYWARKSANFNVSIDGVARQISQTVTHLTGCVDIQYRPSQKTLPAQVLIQTPDHTITFVPSDFIFYTLQIHDDNIDSSLVGGALGQSAGAGVIDLNEADFRVTTNFGTEKSANYNAGNSFVCP